MSLTRDQRAALDEYIAKLVTHGIARSLFQFTAKAKADGLIPKPENVDRGREFEWYADRQVDRSLQRLRKRGVIRFVGGKWEAGKS